MRRFIYKGCHYEVIGEFNGVPLVFSVESECVCRLQKEKLDAALRTAHAQIIN